MRTRRAKKNFARRVYIVVRKVYIKGMANTDTPKMQLLRLDMALYAAQERLAASPVSDVRRVAAVTVDQTLAAAKALLDANPELERIGRCAATLEHMH